MLLQSILHAATSALGRHRFRRRRPAARRLTLEALESRTVPALMAPVYYPVEALAARGSIAAADFNADGRSDLAVHRDAAPGGVGVLMANGDGTFQPIRYFPSDVSYGGPQSLATGDFNGDGRIDLATANLYDLSILLGNGDGSFAAPITRTLPDYHTPISVAVGDLNADGILDLAVGVQDFNGDPNIGKYLDVLLGNGDGTFATPIVHVLPPDADTYAHPWVVQLGDLNGDAKLDVVAARMSHTVNVLLGNGDGSLGSPATFAAGTASAVATQSLVLGDLNADGHLDLVTGDSNGATVSVLLGDGTGAFPTYSTYTTGNRPAALALADMNGDGRVDLVTSNSGSQDVGVLFGQSNGAFAAPRNFPAGTSPYSMTIGNFNGDAFADVAVINSNGRGLSVLPNDGDWTFAAPPTLRINDVVKAEGKTGTTYFTFTVTLAHSSDVPVTFNYATADGTAKISNNDYVAKSGTVTFAPGETTKTITIAIKGDKKKEGNETFFVNLSNAVNAGIFDGQGLGTILNDD